MINPWFETIGVILVAISGIVLGRMFSKSRKCFWVLGYLVPSVLIFVLLLPRFAVSLTFVPPFCWIAAGRARFVLLALAVTMGLTVPLSRLPRRCEKVIIYALMVAVVAWFCVMPFLVPALIKDHLSKLNTRFNTDGICFQSTDYTCAPAAAVTALRKLGLAAHEGQIAILSHTSPVAGTLPGCLQSALQQRYGAEGLRCQYRHFDSVEQLDNAGVTLAVVKDSFLTDHCVAVLEVTDRIVTLADPVFGKRLMPRKQFEKIWRFTGIILKRKTVQSL